MRILTIGGSVPGIEHDSEAWDTKVNIKDYNTVFLNLDKIVERSDEVPGPTSEIPHKIKFPPQEDIKKSLKAGHNIFVFLPRTRYPNLLHVTEEDTKKVEQDLLSWLPFKVRSTEETGTSVNRSSVSENWEWYFDSDFDWPLFIEKINLTSDDAKHLFDTVHQHTIASTAFGEDIACRIGITAGTDIATALAENGEINDRKYSGSLFLLPIRPNWRFKNVVRGVLSNLYGWSIDLEETAQPNWLDQHYLPRQKSIGNKIKELRQEYAELDKFRKLLYMDGEELEETVIQAFEYLGFETEDEISGKRDGLVHLSSKAFVLEIEGTTNDIGIKKCRQLDDWVENAQEEFKNTGVDGLLVANANRTLQPAERESCIAGNSQEFLEKRGYKVIETPELFSLISKSQSGVVGQEEIEEAILDSDLFVTIS
ncbi:hypothetical protein [Halorussus ruber]|uniref:hypothetical protein n=1 Tax=Halorussus ruber TaxID=1126238 RepID=UPI001092ACA1|nr:hypothetical protein [Halorussus ruber]